MGEVVPPPEILSGETVANIAAVPFLDGDDEPITDVADLAASHEELRARVEAAERDTRGWKAVATLANRDREAAEVRVEALTEALADLAEASRPGNMGGDSHAAALSNARRVLADGGTTDPVPPEVVDAARDTFSGYSPPIENRDA